MIKKILIICVGLIISILLVGLFAGIANLQLTNPPASHQLPPDPNQDSNRKKPKDTNRNFLIRVSLAGYPEAKCNDGTTASYYYRPGIGINRNNWIVFLQGGANCANLTSCAKRREKYPELMTTSSKETKESEGIFSINERRNPDFFNFNHVIVPYCSSDVWSGNRNASDQTRGLSFKGKAIVQAVFESLKSGRSTNYSINDADKVLLAGSSAGGLGVQHNLDDVGQMLPTSVNLSGLVDSWWLFDKSRALWFLRDEEPQKENSNQVGIKLWNSQLDDDCPNQNDLSCQGENILPFLSHPIFVYQDLSDEFWNYSRFSQQQIAQIKQARISSLSKVGGVFVTDNGTHGALTSNSFFEPKIQGYSYSQILSNWLFEKKGPKRIFDKSKITTQH